MMKFGVCSIAMHMFIAVVLKDVELGIVGISVSDTLFIVNESSALIVETHSKVIQLLYVGKRISMNILTVDLFLITRVTKTTEKDKK